MEAEAMKKQGEAQKMKWVVDVLPLIAKEVAEPFKQVSNISVYDTAGNETGAVDKVATYVPNTMKRVFDLSKDIAGIDMINLVNADSMDAKVNTHLTIDGITPNKEETK